MVACSDLGLFAVLQLVDLQSHDGRHRHRIRRRHPSRTRRTDCDGVDAAVRFQDERRRSVRLSSRHDRGHRDHRRHHVGICSACPANRRRRQLSSTATPWHATAKPGRALGRGVDEFLGRRHLCRRRPRRSHTGHPTAGALLWLAGIFHAVDSSAYLSSPR